MYFSDCLLRGTKLTEGSNCYVLKSIPRFVPRSCFPEAAANTRLSKAGILRQAHSCKMGAPPTGDFGPRTPSQPWQNFLRVSLQSKTFPFFPFLCPSQESDMHCSLMALLASSSGSCHIFPHSISPNKSLVHLISSWGLPLGGPGLTQNVTSYRSSKDNSRYSIRTAIITSKLVVDCHHSFCFMNAAIALAISSPF